jgi:hypothetical protein
VPGDVKTVVELLNNIGADRGGTREAPILTSSSARTLHDAIFRFQMKQNGLGRLPLLSGDGHVDPGDKTIVRLNQEASPPVGPDNPPVHILPAPVPVVPPGVAPPASTAWHIVNSKSLSLSGLIAGAAFLNMDLTHDSEPSQIFEVNFIGGGVSLGPLPAGVEFSTSNNATVGRVFPGQGVTSDFGIETLLGPACVFGGSIAAPQPGAGGGFAVICFNANALAILALLTAGAAIGGSGMVGLALKHSKAVGVMAGTSQGVNAGFFFNIGRIAPGS